MDWTGVPESGSPSHRVVTGPIAALEEALADHVFAAKGDDPLTPVVVLIGETLLRPYLRRRLMELHGPHMNVHLMTSADLGLRLGEPAMIAAGRLPLPILADRVLAHEAAHATGGYFAPVQDTPGFANALHRTLGDLHRGDCSAEHLVEAGADLPEQEKISSLARLAAEHDRLRAGHYDSDQALAGAVPSRLDAPELIVYGRWEAPEILRRAIAAIGRSQPVTVYLPTADPSADRAHAPLREWLVGELGATPVTLEPAAQDAGSLAHVQAHLGDREAPATSSPEDGTVQIVSAPDPSREVRAALRACLGWAREGIPLHEMAIAYRHPEPYRTLISAIAREAGLPLYDYAGTPLTELPVGRRALALLDLLEHDLDRASVIAFATDNRRPQDLDPRYVGSAAQWDRFSSDAGIVRGIDQWRERLQSLTERMEERFRGDDDNGGRPEWADARLAQVGGLLAYAEDLHNVIAGRPGTAPWSEHVAHLEAAFNRYLEDHKPILDAVRALAHLDSLTDTATGERFLAVVRSVIAGLRADETSGGSGGALRAQGINVMDANSLRQLRFRAVCVVGLAERAFPPAPRQDPLLLDDERAVIGLPLRARGADLEPLQFALAVHAAGERLLLSHPRTEHGSGRPLIASSFLRAAAEALAGERISAEALPERNAPWLRRLGADHVGAPTLEEALDAADYDRALIEDDLEVGIALLARRSPNAARGRRAWLARAGVGDLTEFEGGLTAAVLADLARHPRIVDPMSPSALEKFATCPLQFFFTRVLGLRDTEEPEDVAQISPMDRGNLMHAVFERAMSEWLPDDPPRPERRDAHLRRLREIADAACKEAEQRGLTGLPGLWTAERDAIHLDLRLWYERELDDADGRGYDGAALELSFGLPAGDDPGEHTTETPLELRIGDTPLRFHGRIDRLQWRTGGGGFRVIDYKTGSNWQNLKSGKLAGGKALQLPLYLRAAAQLILGRPWTEGEAQYFFSTRRGGFERVVTAGDQVDEADFERVVGGFSDAINHGTFFAKPGERPCMYCDFQSVCPAVHDHEAQAERKSQDQRVIDVTALSEIE